jgi:serine protease Do
LPSLAADQTLHLSDSAALLQAEFSSVVKHATPAVVSVMSSRVVKVGGMQSMPDDPLFRQFFGQMFPWQFQTPSEQREQGLGSGVIISSDGYILTNNHVVDQATDVQVSLSNMKEYGAEIVGVDPRSDLAVLKIEATDLPTMKLGDSSKLEVGDLVFAIGNPFGVGQTVTMGIVSATGRGDLGIEDYEDFIQTDAAINPGNSGGALINIDGDLVGINTAIVARGGGNNGIGFAIPSNMAKYVGDQIRSNGQVVRGYLGAYIQNVTPEIAKALHLEVSSGALISDIAADGPAAKSGLQRGDVVTAVNGEAVSDSRRFRLKIGEIAPGTTVHLTILRNGEELSLPVELGKLDDSDFAAAGQKSESQGSLRGLQLQELTPAIKQSLGLDPGVEGVVISSVSAASQAEEAGLRRGDVVQEVNRQLVTSVDQFKEAVRGVSDQPWLLLVNRNGNTLFSVVGTD